MHLALLAFEFLELLVHLNQMFVSSAVTGHVAFATTLETITNIWLSSSLMVRLRIRGIEFSMV
jgi:hypothetical protein